MRNRCFAVAVACGLSLTASAFSYDVRQPGDVLRPTWSAADTRSGVWTLNVTNALAKAQADGKCTILLTTGSWWCPYCETLEETVLDSQAWHQYLEEEGHYLALLDFPYRNDVPEDQVDQSWHPELGKGWGFKCWLMYPRYLSEIGLTETQGLKAIMDLYEMQKSLALESASQLTISNWNHTAEFTYGKVGYPTLIVIGPDGKEKGRLGFPWYRKADVTLSEAQEYVIQGLDQIVNGACRLCEDPLAGVPPTSAAQTYTGWISSGAGKGIEGLVTFKTTRANSKGRVKVSGRVTVGGKTTTFPALSVDDMNEYVTLTKKSSVAFIKFGEVGLSGSILLNGTKYEIVGGGRDVFTAKDDAAKERAADVIRGVWNVVLKPTDKVAPSDFASGYGTLSVELKAKGKATVSGTLGDGTRVNVSGQVIYGDDGSACLPVLAKLYSNKGGIGFVMWFRNGKLHAINDVAPWVAGGRDPFTAHVQPTFTMSSGTGTVEEELEFSLVGFNPEGTLGGYPLAEDPTYDDVMVSRTKWVGTETTRFTASCVRKTGVLKGTMYFYVMKPTGKTSKVKGTFTGVVMGGSGYGTVVVKGEGSWAVKIAVCGGCSE